MKKDKALKKATMTFGDSLTDSIPPNPLPVLAQYPHFTSMPISGGESGDPLNTYRSSEMHTNPGGMGYTETQYHTGLHLDDIESIHISPGNMSEAEINKVLHFSLAYSAKTSKQIPIKYYSKK